MKYHYYSFAVVLFIGLALSLCVSAQNPFDWSQDSNGNPYVAAPSVASGMDISSSPYSSTIYDVYTDEVPSDAANPNGGKARDNQSGIRTLGGGTDPGEQSDESPVGEPIVLILFATIFAAAIAYRRRRSALAKVGSKLFSR